MEKERNLEKKPRRVTVKAAYKEALKNRWTVSIDTMLQKSYQFNDEERVTLEFPDRSQCLCEVYIDEGTYYFERLEAVE